MKSLFVTFNGIGDLTYGGGQCSNRNYNLVSDYYTTEVITVKKINNIFSLLSIVQQCFPPLTLSVIRNIMIKIQKERYDMIFLDSSLFGVLCKKIKLKYPDIRIVVFFHNVEVNYINVRMGKGIKHDIYVKLAEKSEKCSVKYADKMIALNSRDAKRIFQLYHRKPKEIFPITFDDKYIEIKQFETSEKKVGLFVGSLGNANYEGIKWFIKNSTLLNQFELQVVGKDFEKVRNEFREYPVNIIGSVDNLQEYYEQADFVISPVLFGGGMKVKIAEALMYGKVILGTDEALEGYYVGECSFMHLCNSIEEFDLQIKRILSSSNPKFNAMSRKEFLENYNTDVIKKKWEKMMLSE